MKILLAIDGSPCSELAVDEVARRPWPAGSTVKVLSVVGLIAFSSPEAATPTQEYYDVMERAAREDVERAASILRREATTKLQVETVICTGFPKQMILDQAEGWGADLVVLGSHGRGLAGRFLLGSVSQAVALHAGCSVLIVRHKERE